MLCLQEIQKLIYTAQDLMAKSLRNSDLDLHSTRKYSTRDELCSPSSLTAKMTCMLWLGCDVVAKMQFCTAMWNRIVITIFSLNYILKVLKNYAVSSSVQTKV